MIFYSINLLNILIIGTVGLIGDDLVIPDIKSAKLSCTVVELEHFTWGGGRGAEDFVRVANKNYKLTSLMLIL